MIPTDNACENQFGFRKGRGVDFACTLFNDVKAYFEHNSSPMFACSLDAEKCFDSICHISLFYKLWNKIPHSHWLLLYRWYSNLQAVVKWKDNFSRVFRVTKGTRQGSLLSPQLFNIFIDDLLHELKKSQYNVSIGPCKINSFAYADDITVLCTTTIGLQSLIDICAAYAQRWRLKFGIKKTKCMIISGDSLIQEPVWYLNGVQIDNVNSLEILGVKFDSSNSSHVEHRSEQCRRSFYSLRDVGMSFPGCSPDVKSYLWNTICQPVLLYGINTLSVPKKSIQRMETVQGNLIKQSLGLSKRSRSSWLLQALGIEKVEDKIIYNTASLLRRIFTIDSPIKDLTSHFLSLYITHGMTTPGTIIDRVVKSGLSPTNCIFNNLHVPKQASCGVVDSLRMLLMQENFIKPYSEQHILVSLLTRAF